VANNKQDFQKIKIMKKLKRYQQKSFKRKKRERERDSDSDSDSDRQIETDRQKTREKGR